MRTMATVYSLAKEMGVCHATMRRHIRTGRIPGVALPQPGEWHYLTLADIEQIKQWYAARTR